MELTLRRQRLRLTWLLLLPYLVLARPSPERLLAGLGLALGGLLLRGFAAAHIHKDLWLATRGPYRFIRHPLYAGSFLLGLGLSLAGGGWTFSLVFLGLFFWVYRRTVRAEETELERRFGDLYQDYRNRVPSFLPRILPRRRIVSPSEAYLPQRGSPEPPHVGLPLYLRNKEWEAALGTALGFLLLWLRMRMG